MLASLGRTIPEASNLANRLIALASNSEVSDHISGVSEGAKTNVRSAAGVKSAAEALSQQSERLRLQVHDFLGKIRAA